MTEKRFTVEKLELVSDHLSTRFFIVDNENMRDYDVQHIVSEGFEVQFDSWAEKIADKLNELNEKNQFLKKKLEFFYELNKPYGTIIEENKRLKSFISRLTNDCGEIVLMNGMGYNVKKIFGDLE